MDQTGCSDGVASDLTSDISEFSSTPNTSACSTPELSPINKGKGMMGKAIPSTSLIAETNPQGSSHDFAFTEVVKKVYCDVTRDVHGPRVSAAKSNLMG